MENKSESRKCFEVGQFAVQGLMAGVEAEPNPKIANAIRKITEGANKVENNKIYNDDVERIVNDPERQAIIDERYYKRQMHRQRKMLTTALVYAFFATIFGALGLAGWMWGCLAYPVCAACGVWSAFNFGRWFENGKCWGWR